MGAMAMSAENELVMVPVPKHLLKKVYYLIATDGTEPQTPPAMTRREAQGQEWTAERLRQAATDGGEYLCRVFRTLRDQRDEWVAATDLAATLGTDLAGKPATPNTLYGVLGSFERRRKKVYAGTTVWPFDYRPNPATGEAEYSMPASIADRLQNL